VTGELTAYDEITLGGLGQAEVTIERSYVEPLPTGDEGAGAGGRDGTSPSSPSPTG
jgi:hypothetical protein